MVKLSKFIDTSRCTGCRGCQTACKSWNELPAEILDFKGALQTHTNTSPTTITYVDMKERWADSKMEWFFLKRQCLHCTDAACEKVCPEKAISHTASGAVVRDKDKCIGCDYCAQYCPFGIPKVNQDDKKMYKCNLCAERVSHNLRPACAKTCAPGAIRFGERDKMVAEARQRLVEIKKNFPKANLYGLDEQFLNGTNVFYLLLETPEFYGLKAKPEVSAMVGAWNSIIKPMGRIFPLGAAGAILVSAFMTRVANVSQQSKGNSSSRK